MTDGHSAAPFTPCTIGRAVALALTLVTAGAARAQLPPATRRALVVVSDGWSATTGTLRRFERDGGEAPWRAVGAVVPVVLGKAGLGWGDGLLPPPPASDGPQKVEGDRRTPAGVFALGDVTGYDAAPPPGLSLAYRAATPALRCVDDPAAAPYYNRLVDAPDGPAPWGSDEKMRRPDELYRFTVFVRHNEARSAGRGSCVFLHVWRRPDAPTVGCTAMALPSLRALLPFVDRTTVLIELPRATYARLQREWGLPPLPPAGVDQR